MVKQRFHTLVKGMGLSEELKSMYNNLIKKQNSNFLIELEDDMILKHLIRVRLSMLGFHVGKMNEMFDKSWRMLFPIESSDAIKVKLSKLSLRGKRNAENGIC